MSYALYERVVRIIWFGSLSIYSDANSFKTAYFVPEVVRLLDDAKAALGITD